MPTRPKASHPRHSALSWLPWTDRAGRLSWLKLAAFVLLMAPAIYMIIVWRIDRLPNPITFVVKESGAWSMRFLVGVIGISPLRRISSFSRLILIRRMVGLAALSYGLAHLAFYFASQDFNWPLIIDGMLHALYLTTGYVALALMIALGLTSNDASIRLFGTIGWRRLHWLVFPSVLLSLLHFLLEVRVDADEVAIMGGVLIFLAIYRLSLRFGIDMSRNRLLILAPVCALATALLEAAYYRWGTGVHAESILRANIEWSEDIRPSWWVLAIGLGIAFAGSFHRPRPKVPGQRRAKTRTKTS